MKRIFTPAKKKSILIVDDDPFATQVYREKLEAQGFKVEVTRDFDSTLQTLKKEVFDLLILDLCLPGINVVELIKNIRSESATQSLPIIVFSNPYLGNLTRAAVEEGATKFVAKVDNTPEQMIELLRELGVSGSATSTVGVSGMIGTPEANQEAARQLSEFHPDGTGRFASYCTSPDAPPASFAGGGRQRPWFPQDGADEHSFGSFAR